MIDWSYPLDGASTLDPSMDFAGGANTGEIATTYELDPATWDLVVPLRILRGAPAVVQRIRCRFRFWFGEWFLDTRLGVPYRERVLLKNPDTNLISALFRDVLVTTPGVRAVETFRAELDASRRFLSCDFLAYLVDGAQVVSQGEPFVVI